jgi:hypothetical protein
MTELGQRESGNRVIIVVLGAVPECKAAEHILRRACGYSFAARWSAASSYTPILANNSGQHS